MCPRPFSRVADAHPVPYLSLLPFLGFRLADLSVIYHLTKSLPSTQPASFFFVLRPSGYARTIIEGRHERWVHTHWHETLGKI